MCDASFASDFNNRRSVTGYMIFFCEVLVTWKIKLQKGVTKSTTESEYVSLSELSGEILFLTRIVKFMGVEVEYPIVVEVDNAGAIFLANNKALGQRTKHIDTHYHFTREYVEDGIIKIRYVRTDDNTSDVMTKNTALKTFWKHCENLPIP